MIRAKSITIEEFRGIRSLTIDFKEKNFAVCGPNGTGKSGIVDALEFALTASISRLSGKNTGSVSVKEHAPHVDSRNRPDKARVILTVSIPHLGKEVKIERSVKDATNPTITPDEPDVRAVLDQVAQHPEFVLSRRELIRFIITAPGDRSKAVQTLLRLDAVEDTRATLLKISNAKQKETDPLLQEKNNARNQLLAALQIAEFNKEKVLQAVNTRRAILSLPALSELTPTTSVRDGLAATPVAQATKVSKSQALADLKKLRESIQLVTSQDIGTVVSALIEELETLNSNPEMLNSVSREQFLKSSLSLIDGEACPLCDKPWSIDELKAVIQTKLKRFEEIARKRTDLEKQLEPLSTASEDLASGLAIACRYGPLLTPPIAVETLRQFKTNTEKRGKQFEVFLPLPATIRALKDLQFVPADVMDTIIAVETAVMAIPEATEQDAARDYLTIGQEKLENWRRLSLEHQKAEEQAVLAKKVYEAYATASTSVLEGVYKQVEKDFSELYREVNKDDESGFTAQLVPSTGKLGLDVDFFGRGFFPPGAYHSEGHQDGMGICLYLALMRHLLGQSFTFAVLDDVLMSVDAGHRREVCNMLKKYFPDTQFIFTTHDEIWLRAMRSVGLITQGASIQFRTWDVDHGPTKWDDRDVWQQIRDEVSKENDVRAAASLMRHYLEHISSELCHRLGARVQFRGDARFELGDLLPSAVSRYKELLRKGKASAQSWGKTEELTAITTREEEFAKLVETSNVEQWMINAAVHFNQWENLQSGDFIPVVDAYQKIIAAFVCTNADCDSTLYILPERGEAKELRCACGATNINLVKKPTNT